MLTLAPNDKVPIYRFIIKAKPTVFVFLHPHSLHLEIDLKLTTLYSSNLILLNKVFSNFITLKSHKAVRLSHFLLTLALLFTLHSLPLLAIKVLEMADISKVLDELLDLL